MKVYLDNCCFNRPFDNQEKIRIYLETQAKLYIQKMIRQNKLELIWSFILDTENRDNPFQQKRLTIQEWEKYAKNDISYSEELYNEATNLINNGIKPKDALHIISASYGKADYFLTTDDKICKKINEYKDMIILNPIDFVKIIEEYDL